MRKFLEYKFQERRARPPSSLALIQPGKVAAGGRRAVSISGDYLMF